MPKTKKDTFELSNLELDEVSLVTAGANPEAKIVLAKAHSPQITINADSDIETALKFFFPDAVEKARLFNDVLADQNNMNVIDQLHEDFSALRSSLISIAMDEEIDDKQKEARLSLHQFESKLIGSLINKLKESPNMDKEALIAKVAELETNLADVTKRAETAEAEITKLKADKGKDKQDIDKSGLSPEVLAYIEKQEAKDKANQERIEKLENQALTEKFEKQASTFGNVPGTDSELGELLKAASASFTDAQFDRFTALLKSANEVFKGLIGNEIGGSGGDDSSIIEKVAGLAKEMMEKDSKLTIQKARMTVFNLHPEMKDSYNEAVRNRAH